MALEVGQLIASVGLERIPHVEDDVLAHRQTGHVAKVADLFAELVVRGTLAEA